MINWYVQKKAHHVTLFMVILLFLYNNAYAQQSITDTTLTMKEIVVSASKIEKPVSETGRSVTVITRSEIDQSTYSSVGDILARQKGIHMVGNSQTPGSLQSVFLRNADNDQVVIMIDGIRISDPSAVENTIDLSELSLANVARIEIVRGSHSTIFGSSAIGGVINIITQKGGEPGFRANMDSKLGAFGDGTSTTTQNGWLSYTTSGGFYANVSTLWERTEGIDATIDTVTSTTAFNPTDQDDFDKLDLTVKTGYQRNGWNGYIGYRRSDQEVQVDQGSFVDDDNAFADFRRNLITYGADRRLSKTLDLQFRGGFSNLDRLNADDSSLVNRAGDFDGSVSRTNTDATLLENELRATFKRDKFKLVSGFNSSRQTMNIKTLTIARQFNFFQQTNLDSLNLTEWINSFYLHTELNGGLLSSSLSRFSLALGMRVLNHDQFGAHTTYEINPSFRFSDRTIAFAAVTTGFNAPSLFQLESPDKGFGEITTLGNDQLDPETSISYEIGLRHQFGNRAGFDFSIYRTNIEDAIEFVNLWDGDVPIDELTFSEFLGDTYLNASEQKISGLEFGVDLQVTPEFSVGGDISAASSELQFAPDLIDSDQTEGNHVQVFETGEFIQNEKEIDGLTRRPSVSGKVKAAYRPIPSLRISVISQFTGSRDDVFFSNSLGPFGALDREELDSYNVTDVTVSYDITNRIRLTGKVENLFDSEYQEIRGFQSRERGFYLRARYAL